MRRFLSWLMIVGIVMPNFSALPLWAFDAPLRDNISLEIMG
jgi:hypothetical protein